MRFETNLGPEVQHKAGDRIFDVSEAREYFKTLRIPYGETVVSSPVGLFYKSGKHWFWNCMRVDFTENELSGTRR